MELRLVELEGEFVEGGVGIAWEREVVEEERV